MKVIFRIYKDKTKEVIALFPEHEWSSTSDTTCYVRNGQHGGADWEHILAKTRLATNQEYKSLLKELYAIGYGELDICKRKGGAE